RRLACGPAGRQRRVRGTVRARLPHLRDRTQRRADACRSPAAAGKRRDIRTTCGYRRTAEDYRAARQEGPRRMTISTHVLDASLGAPAAGVSVTLSRLAGGWLDVESGVTDPDGRHRFVADTLAGTYCLTFGTGPYFAARAVPTFYPEVAI